MYVIKYNDTIENYFLFHIHQTISTYIHLYLFILDASFNVSFIHNKQLIMFDVYIQTSNELLYSHCVILIMKTNHNKTGFSCFAFSMSTTNSFHPLMSTNFHFVDNFQNLHSSSSSCSFSLILRVSSLTGKLN